MGAILDIIKIWLDEGKCIICLQEVPESLLSALKAKGYKLAHTREEDTIRFQFGPKENPVRKTEYKKEYRVTIVSPEHDIVYSNDIVMYNGLAKKYVFC
jgi:hypothetical protein